MGLTLSHLISIRHQLGFDASKLDHLGHFTFFGDESAKLTNERSSLAVWYRQDSTLRDGGIQRSGSLARPIRPAAVHEVAFQRPAVANGAWRTRSDFPRAPNLSRMTPSCHARASGFATHLMLR
jgi:hypothetical protein